MLSQLTIQNFGLIDKMTVEFGKGLNVLTGATGAGKSILIDAIQYSLGKRINSSQVRDAEKTCTVETVLDIAPRALKEIPSLAEYVEKDEPVLIISRSYMPDGRSKNKINGFTVTTPELKEIGDKLIDLHGPHDHQMLFSENLHIEILDRLSDISGPRKDYGEKYSKYNALKKKILELEDLSKNKDRELGLIKHQIKELEQVPLDEAEYEKLLADEVRIKNSEKLFECVNQVISILDSDSEGVSPAIARAFGPMNALNSIDSSASGFLEILSRMQEDSSELMRLLNNYAESLSFNPAEAEDISRRSDAYHDILRKYGPDLASAGKLYEDLLKKHELLSDLEHNDGELKKELKAAEKDLLKTAEALSKKRKESSLKLEKTIERELKELGISNVRFECRVQDSEITPNGTDKVTFYISPNLGEELKPLADIVSSGEAARVMLALKKALTKVDPVPVLIFDEIDAQIGGRLGAITGKKLKELSADRQVILITHLPQIASFADRHLKVEKSVKDKKTVTEVIKLEGAERAKELARMMSGENETDIALKHAKDMLSKAQSA